MWILFLCPSFETQCIWLQPHGVFMKFTEAYWLKMNFYLCVLCMCLGTFSYSLPRNLDYFLRQQVDKWGLWCTTEETLRSRRLEAFITSMKKSLPLNLHAPQQGGQTSSCWLYLPGHGQQCFTYCSGILSLFSKMVHFQEFYGRIILNDCPVLMSCSGTVLVMF